MRIEVFKSGFLKANTYVVGPDESREALVIDPAGNPARILDYVRRENLCVVAIINTHSHWDHVNANGALKRASGAPIMIHEADAEALSRVSPWAMLLRARARWSPPADRRLREGDTIGAGAYNFEVIHTPGHTPGGICLKYRKILFTGDTLMAGAVGRTNDKDDSWKTISSSIMDKLFILSDDIACYPGHGPKTTIEAERKTNIFVRVSPIQIENWLFGPPKSKKPRQEESVG